MMLIVQPQEKHFESCNNLLKACIFDPVFRFKGQDFKNCGEDGKTLQRVVS